MLPFCSIRFDKESRNHLRTSVSSFQGMAARPLCRETGQEVSGIGAQMSLGGLEPPLAVRETAVLPLNYRLTMLLFALSQNTCFLVWAYSGPMPFRRTTSPEEPSSPRPHSRPEPTTSPLQAASGIRRRGRSLASFRLADGCISIRDAIEESAAHFEHTSLVQAERESNPIACSESCALND